MPAGALASFSLIAVGSLPLVVDQVLDYASKNPVLVGLVVVMLTFVFLVYLFVRRTLLGLREGYQKGRGG